MTYDSGLVDMKNMKKPLALFFTELIHRHKMLNHGPLVDICLAEVVVPCSVYGDNSSPIFLMGRSNSA